jgi:leader peptidase (prepilin peptidase) / N-methyltransferase
VHLGDPILAIAIFLFGLAFGSFLNVCIYRLPLRAFTDEELAARGVERKNLSVVSPGSACPHCKTPIRFYDNVPVLSWLILGGRCRKCRAPITPRYLVVELLTALLFLACYARFGMSWATLKFCVFCFLLLGLIFTDAETKLLPDGLTLSGLGLGLAFSLLVPVDDLWMRLLPALFPEGIEWPYAWRLFSLAGSLVGAALGAGLIWGVGVAYKWARGREGMGFGDVKLMGLIGAFVGVKLMLFTLLGASVVGSLFGIGSVLVVWLRRARRRQTKRGEDAATSRRRAWHSAMVLYQRYEIPFGVFLGGIAVLAVFVGDAAVDWYLGIRL